MHCFTKLRKQEGCITEKLFKIKVHHNKKLNKKNKELQLASPEMIKLACNCVTAALRCLKFSGNITDHIKT